MSTAPSPVVQNQEGLQYQKPASSKLSDLLSTAHGAISTIRDKYSDMANNLADAIVDRANLTPEAAPVKKDLGDVVKAGMSAYGVPVPSRGAGEESDTGAKDAPLESVVSPKGDAEEGIPQGIKIPAGQQKPAKIMSTVQDAAGKNQSLYMTYQNPEWDEPKVYHVEPYSYRGEGNQTLMAYDKTGKGIRAFKLDNVINVTPSGKSFNPRWTVEISPPKKE